MREIRIICCPTCNGTGKIEKISRVSKYDLELKNMAQKLHKSGLSLRQIAKELKIAHPQTVKNLLTTKKKR